MLLTLLSLQTSTLTGALSRTLDGATLVSSGELVTPSTLSAILITGSNNPSYRSGFYSPRRGGTPKYPNLWDGCVGAWAPSLGATGLTLRDESVFGNHGTLTSMDAASDWVVSGGKGALDFDGIDDFVQVPNRPSINSVTHITISFWYLCFSTFPAPFYVRTLLSSQENSPPYKGFDIRGVSASTMEMVIVIGGSSYTVSLGNVLLNTFTYVAATYDGTTLSGYRNNALVGSTAVSGTIDTTTQSVNFGNNPSFSGRNTNCQLDDIRIYNRALSANQIRLLSTRRGIAFERASRKLALFSAPAPTGSVSVTLANATLSATGTLTSGLTGSVSVTLSDASLSATGTLTNAATGSVSSTLADATLSSTGTVAAGASGSVVRTLDAATLSSSGTIGSGLTGSVSASLGAATLSSSGTLAAGASGSVTRTLDNATLSSSGTVAAGASGTVTRTLDNATLSATGGAAGTVSGSVSSTLAAATCSSSGTLTAGLSGTVVRTLDAVTSSATGTLTNGASGTVTRTLANATLASGGSLSAGLTAQVNRALESCVVSSSGTLASGLTGTLSVQLASATLQSGNIAVGGMRIKVGGEWKNANAFVKVTGSWKNATPFVKVSGVWK